MPDPDTNVALERAKIALRNLTILADDMTCYGISVEDFDRESLIIMLKLSHQEKEHMTLLHNGTLEILTACTRKKP